MGDRLWAGIPSRYVTSQVISALHPSGVGKSSTSFGCGKGWNVTSAGWQVTLCDPVWHVSSSSGEATSVSELLYPCYLLSNRNRKAHLLRLAQVAAHHVRKAAGMDMIGRNYVTVTLSVEAHFFLWTQ